jgi:hypothetical protein
MTRIAARLGKLERALAVDGGACPDCCRIELLTCRAGEPEPEPPPCPTCGEVPPFLLVIEVPVGSRAEAEAWAASAREDAPHPRLRNVIVEFEGPAADHRPHPGRPGPDAPPEPPPPAPPGPDCRGAATISPGPTTPAVANLDPPGPGAPPPVPRDGPAFWDALRRDLGDGW